MTQPTDASPGPSPVQPPAASVIHARVILSSHAYSLVTLDGVRGFEFRVLKDLGGIFAEGLRCRWLGAPAEAFLAQHWAEFRPGRALDVSLYHIRSRENETRAYVAAIQIAPLPPSWIKHQETLQQTEQPAQAEPHQEHSA